MPSPRRPPIDPEAHAPTVARPVRAKLTRLAADSGIEPHRHPWAQVAMSATGVIRMTAGRSTYIVPPSRALWVPPDVEHVLTVVEDAEIRTLYVDLFRAGARRQVRAVAGVSRARGFAAASRTGHPPRCSAR